MADAVLTIGTLSAEAGEKTFGVNEFPVQGQPYRSPMWLTSGVQEGPTLLVTAGAHAAEYASIAAALDLGRALVASARNEYSSRRRSLPVPGDSVPHARFS